MATDIWLVKEPGGKLTASSEADHEHINAYKVGDVLKAKVSKPRNGKHHRLGMMLLQAVFDNQDKYTAFKPFLNEVKILTGLVTTHISSDGQVYYIVGSIAFDNMDELEFRTWKNDALNVVIQHFIPDMAPADRDRLEHYILTVG